MSEAIEGVTAVDGTQDRSSSQNDPYDWFYNPAYSQGINKGTSSFMDQVNQTSQDEQNNDSSQITFSHPSLYFNGVQSNHRYAVPNHDGAG